MIRLIIPDQADVEDLACSRPEVLEVLDQAWDGPVDQVAGCVSDC